MRKTSPLRTVMLLCMVITSPLTVAQQPQLLFEDPFENAQGQPSMAAGWIHDEVGSAAAPGCVGNWSVAKPVSGEWSAQEVRPGWMFHPLPYDPLLQYQARARLWVHQGDWSAPRTAFIGFAWYSAGAASPWANVGSASTQQDACPAVDLVTPMFHIPTGPPGAVFGLVVYLWADDPVEFFLDAVQVYTLPYRARFSGKVLLQGPYDPAIQLMRDDLRVQGLIPLQEPYTALGFPQVAGGGGESVTQAVLNATCPGGRVVDWLRLELRSATNNTVVVATRQVLLLQDGTVMDTDPSQQPLFSVQPGVYWIAARHRNHLGCMTSSTRTLPYPGGGGTWFHDLTFPAGLWGDEPVHEVGGTGLLWAGNALPDDRLKYVGDANDRDAILVAIGGVNPNAMVAGYRVEDVNMDGLVKYTGADNDRDPILTNIGGVIPTNQRLEQLT